MIFLYNIGIHIYGFFIFLYSFFNEKAKKRYVGQQAVFSYLRSKFVNDTADYIWLHAASLGEFEQGRPVIEALKQKHPEYKILLTFFSPSGFEVRKNYEGAEIICYLPLDTKSNARKFLRIVNPKKAVFIKYEFWPNLLLQCKRSAVPTYVVSSIFRENQAFFKWYGGSYSKVLKIFKHIFVQDENSKILLNNIGISNVLISGDTRFDRVISIAETRKELPRIKDFKAENRLIVAGSSWEKDEDLLIRYLKETPNVKMIIAPHEIPESHLKNIEEKIGKGVVRYSQYDIEKDTDAICMLIDNFGLLSSTYQYADIAYIGGGFGVGIHNVLEAAVYGVAVVFGPNYKQFREARDLVQLGAGFSVLNQEQLNATFNQLYTDEDARVKAEKYVLSQRGATDRILSTIFEN